MIRFVVFLDESGVSFIKAVWLDPASEECLAWARYCGLVRRIRFVEE